MGVMILAGSDFAGMAYVYPGISLHQELKLLVDAGLSNYEALKTATINPAKTYGMDHQLGSVEVGKLADLIVIVIVGILSAIALPNFLSQSSKAKLTEAQQRASAGLKQAGIYFVENFSVKNLLLLERKVTHALLFPTESEY